MTTTTTTTAAPCPAGPQDIGCYGELIPPIEIAISKPTFDIVCPGVQAVQSGSGSVGPRGKPGSDGRDGRDGMSIPGKRGPIGLTGSQGSQGPIGLTGSQGSQGPIGLTGSQGSQGQKGNTGSQGPIGPSSIPEEFWARITTYYPAECDKWYYSFEEVVKVGLGYDGWDVLLGGRIGTHAINSVEDPNQCIAVDAPGKDLAIKCGGVQWYIQPATMGSVVRMLEQELAIDDFVINEYRFAWENGMDCIPAPPSPPSIPSNQCNIKISEFRTRGPLGSNDSFIELFNPTADYVDISDWTISMASSAPVISTLATIPAQTLIGPGGYYLLAYQDGTYGTTTTTTTTPVPPIDDGCCDSVPANLTAVFTAVGNCACADGLTIALTYNPAVGHLRWEGSGIWPCTTNPVVEVTLTCTPTACGAPPVTSCYQLGVNYVGIGPASIPVVYAVSCDPFVFQNDVTVGNVICPGEGTFTVTIS